MRTPFTQPILMFPILVVLLVQVAQGGRIQPRHDGADAGRVLIEGGLQGLTPQLVALLKRCLADEACSEALAVVPAVEASAARQQQPGPGDDAVAARQSAASLAADPEDASSWWALPSGSDGLRLDSYYRSHSGGGISGGIGGGSSGEGDGDDGSDEETSVSLKGLAALVLLAEAIAGMYLPLLLQRLQSPQWWLSLLNCFSGGIFLAAGIVHLLPHCAEAQEALGPIGPNGGDYPLYLVLVVVGYCVVFFVERVLFDVHGEGHWHCQHSNVFSHSRYYKAMSHRTRPLCPGPSGAAAAGTAAATNSELVLPGDGGHPSRLGLDGGAGEEVPSANHQHDGLDGSTSCPAAARTVAAEAAAAAPPCGDTSRVPGEPQLVVPHHHHHHHGRRGSHLHGGPKPSAGEDCARGGLGLVVGGEGGGGEGDREDADSCHSEHTPRAVCVCVEEVEEVEAAEAREQRSARRSHQHDHPHGHSHGQGHSHGHGDAAAFASGSGGGRGVDQLRVPLLQSSQDSVPSLPTSRLDGDAGLTGDLRGLAWQHLREEQQQQQSQQQQLPHMSEICHYHTHHSHHAHHSNRYRPAGPSAAGGCNVCAAAPHSRGGSSGGSSGGSVPHSSAHHSHNLDHLHPHPHSHHAHDHHQHMIKPRFRFMHGVVLLVALALHTALECIALGLIDSRPQFLVLFLAIASHKAVSALALSSRFLKEGANMTQVTMYVGPFCLIAPLSILAGVYVGRVAPIARLVFSCFATGTFLYVGASEVIMEEFEGEMRADRRDISTRAARYMKFAAVLAAVALVAASGLLPEPHHN